MSKSTAFIIAALAGCFGLIAGILAMSSQVETYKKEKKQAEVALKEATQKAEIAIEEAVKKTKSVKQLATQKELSLKTELNKTKYAKDQLDREVDRLKGQLNQTEETAESEQSQDSSNEEALSFYDIRKLMHVMTEAKWKMYVRSLEGKKVYWEGWVDEVNEKFFGDYEVWVDMDPPKEDFSVQDVTFDIPSHIAMKLNKNDHIRFRGTIKSILNILGSCQVSLENTSVLQQ